MQQQLLNEPGDRPIRRALPSLCAFALACQATGGDADPPPPFTQGFAWHSVHAPLVFGEVVVPELAGCVVRSTESADVFGGPPSTVRYDRRGRPVYERVGTFKRGQIWSGPCLAYEATSAGYQTTHRCEDGWPVETTYQHEDDPPSTELLESVFDEHRLVERWRDGKLDRTYAWEGDQVVERVTHGAGGPTTVTYTYLPDAIEEEAGGITTRWEFDALGRKVLLLIDDQPQRAWTYDGDDPKPTTEADLSAYGNVTTHSYTCD